MTDVEEFSKAVKAHLKEFKKLPKEERAAVARDRLIRSGVIDENGEFTDHYAYSREYYKRKGMTGRKAKA